MRLPRAAVRESLRTSGVRALGGNDETNVYYQLYYYYGYYYYCFL